MNHVSDNILMKTNLYMITFSSAAIRLGEYNTDTDVDCLYTVCADLTQDYRPSRILIPDKYGKPRLKHDIAMIKLHKPARITSKIFTLKR